MNPWLYQMAEDEDWTPEDFRVTVWEGENVTWEHKKVMSQGGLKPAPGDPVVFFFAKSRTKTPGICGWAVIVKVYPKKEVFTFRAVPPTDLLKMNPVWGNEVSNQVLYDLCRGCPAHIRDEEILAKVLLIGRVYAAAIERRRNKDDDHENDRFYTDSVVPATSSSNRPYRYSAGHASVDRGSRRDNAPIWQDLCPSNSAAPR